MVFNTSTYASEHAEAHRVGRTRRRFWYSVAAALALIVAVGCGGGTTGSSDPDTAAPPAAGQDATSKTDKAAEGKPAGIGDGQYEVGSEIQVGDYRTTVPADSFGCYWARVHDFDGELQSIIANGNLQAGARGRITVKKTDAGVEFTGGCTWKRVSK